MNKQAKLRHPNLVTFVGAVFNKDLLPVWILSELAPTSLKDMLKKNMTESKKLSKYLVLSFSRDILCGLDYIHNKLDGMHRDLKPGNILIGHDMMCKLCDFGCTKFNLILHDNHTMVGTPQYCAPEVASGKYTNSIDIWSFGVILVEMIVGNLESIGVHILPKEGKEAQDSLVELAPLIDQTLQITPKRPTVREILDQLRKICDISNIDPPEKKDLIAQNDPSTIVLHNQINLLKHENLLLKCKKKVVVKGKLQHPNGIVISNDQIVVGDSENFQIKSFDFDGNLTKTKQVNLKSIFGISKNTFDDLFVVDNDANQVFSLSDNESVVTPVSVKGQLLNPRGIAVHSSGSIVVADCGNSRIQIFEKLQIGNQFKLTHTILHASDYVACDRIGNIYATDFVNDQIVKINSKYEIVKVHKLPGKRKCKSLRNCCFIARLSCYF
jgi:serine/threonine protein kinase